MKAQTVAMILYMILMVFYGIFTLVLSIQAYIRFSNTSQNYLNMSSNYQQPYIIDIQAGTSDCATGYTSLFTWNWQGTNPGCDCSTSTYTPAQKIMYVNACNSTQTTNGCKTSNAIPAKDFKFIQGSSATTPMNVCAKRADSTKAFYKIASQQTGTCTSTQKLCGNPTKPETIICVASSEPCPIYSLFWTSVASASYPAPEWTSLTLPNGFLYFNQKGTSSTTLPNSELRFTQGTNVCKTDNDSKVLPSGSTDYVLMKSKRISCSTYDPTFLQTYLGVAENSYYKLNIDSASYTAMQSWPNFAVPSSTISFNSYYRPYINWKISARDQLYDFVESSDTISKLKTAQLVTMVINIIVCIMVSILLQISQVFNLCGKDVPCISGQGEEEQIRLVRIKKVLTYGSKLLQIPFLLWAFIASAIKKGVLRKAADTSPSDPQYNSEISTFANELEKEVYMKNMTILIIFGVTIFVDLCILIYSCCAKKEKGAKEDNKKENKEGEKKDKKKDKDKSKKKGKKNKNKDKDKDGSSDSSDSDDEEKKKKVQQQLNYSQVPLNNPGQNQFMPPVQQYQPSNPPPQFSNEQHQQQNGYQPPNQGQQQFPINGQQQTIVVVQQQQNPFQPNQQPGLYAQQPFINQEHQQPSPILPYQQPINSQFQGNYGQGTAFNQSVKQMPFNGGIQMNPQPFPQPQSSFNVQFQNQGMNNNYHSKKSEY